MSNRINDAQIEQVLEALAAIRYDWQHAFEHPDLHRGLITRHPRGTGADRRGEGAVSRNRDALHAQAGACNELALANALVSAIREVRAEGNSARDDAAVRLIAHQLSFLLGVSKLDDITAYGEAMSKIEVAVA